LLAERFSPPESLTSLEHAGSIYNSFAHSVRGCMEEINSARQQPAKKHTSSPWEESVRLLLRHAKKRTKVFYRRIKAAYFIPPPSSILPPPRRAIQKILQSQRGFDPSILDNLPTSAPHPNPSPPSKEELRHLSRAVRRKAPGPDGIPPYLLCHLPDHLFSFIHSYVLLMYAEGSVPPEVSLSVTLPLYKGKGSWTDPDRWRPIAMSNSIYRLVARWIYSIILPILLPFLSKHQYGGLRGRSCGMATSQLLNHILLAPEADSCLFLDLYHAFDTPPKMQFLLCSPSGASRLEFCYF
jgi:hypothetical protein